MSRVKQLKDERPDLVDLAEQADQLHDIKALHESNGGKALVELLMKDVVGVVHRLTTAKPEERDALCERLKANLNLAKLIINAEDNEAHLDQMIADNLAE